MIQAGGAALEQRRHHDQVQFLGELPNASGTRAGNALGLIKHLDRLVLAEIRAVVQFLQQNQLGSGRSSFPQAGFDRIQIGVTAAAISFLQQCNFHYGAGHRAHSSLQPAGMADEPV